MMSHDNLQTDQGRERQGEEDDIDAPVQARFAQRQGHERSKPKQGDSDDRDFENENYDAGVHEVMIEARRQESGVKCQGYAACFDFRRTGGACFQRRCTQKYCSGASRISVSSPVVNRCVIARTASGDFS